MECAAAAATARLLLLLRLRLSSAHEKSRGRRGGCRNAADQRHSTVASTDRTMYRLVRGDERQRFAAAEGAALL